MSHHAFHWPDHTIGKRESRRIRDEHNALFNSHAELLAALKQMVEMFEAHVEGRVGPDDAAARWDNARAAITAAESE